MGSPLGLTLANAFLCHFEKKWLSEFPAEFLPSVYKRYVDEIFVTFDSYSQLLKFVDYMNHHHHNIKFVFEVEKNNNFSLVDVKICRKNNKFTTSAQCLGNLPSVVCLLILIVLYLHHTNMVNTSIFRCFKICSSYQKLHNEIFYLKEIFKCNRYPNDFVDLCTKTFFDKLYITKKIYQTVEKSNY